MALDLPAFVGVERAVVADNLRDVAPPGPVVARIPPVVADRRLLGDGFVERERGHADRVGGEGAAADAVDPGFAEPGPGVQRERAAAVEAQAAVGIADAEEARAVPPDGMAAGGNAEDGEDGLDADGDGRGQPVARTVEEERVASVDLPRTETRQRGLVALGIGVRPGKAPSVGVPHIRHVGLAVMVFRRDGPRGGGVEMRGRGHGERQGLGSRRQTEHERARVHAGFAAVGVRGRQPGDAGIVLHEGDCRAGERARPVDGSRKRPRARERDRGRAGEDDLARARHVVREDERLRVREAQLGALRDFHGTCPQGIGGVAFHDAFDPGAARVGVARAGAHGAVAGDGQASRSGDAAREGQRRGAVAHPHECVVRECHGAGDGHVAVRAQRAVVPLAGRAGDGKVVGRVAAAARQRERVRQLRQRRFRRNPDAAAHAGASVDGNRAVGKRPLHHRLHAERFDHRPARPGVRSVEFEVHAASPRDAARERHAARARHRARDPVRAPAAVVGVLAAEYKALGDAEVERAALD